MGVRFDAASERLMRILPAGVTAITMMARITLMVDRNDYSGVLSFDADKYLQTDGDGTTLGIYTGGFDTSGSLQVGPVGTPKWIVLQMVDVSSVRRLRTYVDGVLGPDTVAPGSPTSTAAHFCFGASESWGASEWLNAIYEHGKVWTAALSAEEIINEMRTGAPVRAADLYGWYPMIGDNSERVRDYTGNGRSLTPTGTLTEQGPANGISWGKRGSIYVVTGDSGGPPPPTDIYQLPHSPMLNGAPFGGGLAA